MDSLTEKQADMVALVASAAATGEDASIRHLAAEADVTVNAARERVQRCIKKGYLRRAQRGHRPLRLTEKGIAWVEANC